MVRINNSYDGINESPMDDYIRNLNDSRIGMELSFLPVIDYFVDISESSGNKVLLPSKIFGLLQANLTYSINRREQNSIGSSSQ